MSWKGFQKAVNRAGTTILQSTGVVEKTVDKDFEEQERRFKSLETKVEKLHKEAKGYLDAFRAMSLAQARMAVTIDHFYDESAPLAHTGQRYKEIVERLDDDVRGQLDLQYRHTVLDPLTQFCSYFPDFNEVMKKRSKKLLDYDAVRSKQRKLAEAPDRDATKYSKTQDELSQSRQLYENLNKTLIDEIPKLVGLRVPYLDPSFEALLKIQYNFCKEASEKLGSLQGNFGMVGIQVNAPNVDRMLEDQIGTVLGKMGELSITGMAA
ncbi:BAR adaptor protein Hob3 [Paraphysoderma sedebokerense]|nr:BAR adaptor protein Hob3 [Paraphysoderma sedebokerense]